MEPVTPGRPPARAEGHIAKDVHRLKEGTLRPDENTGWDVVFRDLFPAEPTSPVEATSTNIRLKGQPLDTWTATKKVFGDIVNNMKGMYPRPEANIKSDPWLSFLDDASGIFAAAEDAAVANAVPSRSAQYANAKNVYGGAKLLEQPAQHTANTVAADVAPGGSSRGNLGSAPEPSKHGIWKALTSRPSDQKIKSRSDSKANFADWYGQAFADPTNVQQLMSFYLRNKEY